MQSACFLLLVLLCADARRMRFTNKTTTHTIDGKGSAFIEYFPQRVADQISWSVACVPQCDAKVPAAHWVNYGLTKMGSVYTKATIRAYAEVTMTADVTHITLSLVSWDFVYVTLTYVVILGIFVAAALLAVLIAVMLVICICAFCWMTDEASHSPQKKPICVLEEEQVECRIRKPQILSLNRHQCRRCFQPHHGFPSSSLQWSYHHPHPLKCWHRSP